MGFLLPRKLWVRLLTIIIIVIAVWAGLKTASMPISVRVVEGYQVGVYATSSAVTVTLRKPGDARRTIPAATARLSLSGTGPDATAWTVPNDRGKGAAVHIPTWSPSVQPQRANTAAPQQVEVEF